MRNDRPKAGLCFRVLCISLLLSVPFAEELSRNSVLFSELVKFENVRNDAVCDIGGYESLIRGCEETANKSETIVALAVQRGNSKAEQIAREALSKAQQAKKKYEENESLAETRKTLAEKKITSLRDLLYSKDGKFLVKVNAHSGTVEYFSKRLNKMIAFDDAGVAGFEPGDQIVTSAGSRVQMTLVNGSTFTLGENSTLTVGESNNQSQVVALSNGSIVAEVEKELKKLKGRFQPKLQVGLPSIVVAVRGTKFQASADDSLGTELDVFEGSVEVRNTHGEKDDAPLVVDAGYRVKASKGGIISKPEKIDMAEIERWWEK